jgi:hypothetical protein
MIDLHRGHSEKAEKVGENIPENPPKESERKREESILIT